MENESFNDHFCRALELYLRHALGRFDDKRIKSLSCDGILPPFMEKQLTKKSVNDSRRISGITVFFLGGEDHPNNTVYELTLKLGKYSLRRYAKGSSMVDCIPSEDSNNAVVVDADIKQIELTLR
jgi:hypothetical protein